MSRLHDPIWIIGTLIIIGGFGGVQAYASLGPMAAFDADTGQCLIGIAADASICVIVFDSVIGGVLTGIFIKILWPAIRFNTTESLGSVQTLKPRCSWHTISRHRNDTRGNNSYEKDPSRRQLKAMLWRNVLGSITVLANTLINNVIFLTWEHSHRSKICFLTCMTDSKWLHANHYADTYRTISCLGDAGYDLAKHGFYGTSRTSSSPHPIPLQYPIQYRFHSCYYNYQSGTCNTVGKLFQLAW
jgi:hypothetical protein